MDTGRSQHANIDLFKALPAQTPALPVPRIEIVRFWRTPSGFDTVQRVAWTVKAIGLNEQPIPKEDEVITQRDAEHIASQWQALLGWPIFRMKRVVQTQAIYELETEEDNHG